MPQALPTRPTVDPDAEWRAPGGRPHPVQEPDESEPLETGVVNRGHCISLPDPDQPRVLIGYDKKGAARFIAAPRLALPGETVTLLRSELKRMKRLGFIVDENRSVLPPCSGNVAAAA